MVVTVSIQTLCILNLYSALKFRKRRGGNFLQAPKTSVYRKAKLTKSHILRIITLASSP